jgi:hypothetical protein
VLLRRGRGGLTWASRYVQVSAGVCLCALLTFSAYPLPAHGADVSERKTVVLLYPDRQLRSLIGGLGLMGAVDEVMSRFNYEWLSRAWGIFFAFIPLFAWYMLGADGGEHR